LPGLPLRDERLACRGENRFEAGGFLHSLRGRGRGQVKLPIVDFRLLMDMGRSCHTTFSIVNRQSPIGN
jgi:hypothetical protein